MLLFSHVFLCTSIFYILNNFFNIIVSYCTTSCFDIVFDIVFLIIDFILRQTPYFEPRGALGGLRCVSPGENQTVCGCVPWLGSGYAALGVLVLPVLPLPARDVREPAELFVGPGGGWGTYRQIKTGTGFNIQENRGTKYFNSTNNKGRKKA